MLEKLQNLNIEWAKLARKAILRAVSSTADFIRAG